MASSTWGSY